ncbi:MAG: hypothetical protein GIW99_10245 [Candidatus Eremiobacteraeota bacterium]|nr:hypothetical protein [Candidatus Eremiobacteraeota bacterium]MBC5828041.1 hypothetical protein [Candidatus Eremiobacteraeota bacterium]
MMRTFGGVPLKALFVPPPPHPPTVRAPAPHAAAATTIKIDFGNFIRPRILMLT